MKNLEKINLIELSFEDSINFNGGTADHGSVGYQLGAATARTVGNLLGVGKVLVDAFGDVVKGKFFEKIFS